jgi:hypothetical protein
MFVFKVEAHPVHTFEYLAMRCLYHNWFATSTTDWDFWCHIFITDEFIDLEFPSPYGVCVTAESGPLRLKPR